MRTGRVSCPLFVVVPNDSYYLFSSLFISIRFVYHPKWIASCTSEIYHTKSHPMKCTIYSANTVPYDKSECKYPDFMCICVKYVHSNRGRDQIETWQNHSYFILVHLEANRCNYQSGQSRIWFFLNFKSPRTKAFWPIVAFPSFVYPIL